MGEEKERGNYDFQLFDWGEKVDERKWRWWGFSQAHQFCSFQIEEKMAMKNKITKVSPIPQYFKLQ